DEVTAGALPEAQKKARVQGITQNHAHIVFEALMSTLRKEAKIKIGDALEQQYSSRRFAKNCKMLYPTKA
ncbi:hypothetical protein, partial [Salmonella enterica]|uniref:hypothetical protein n=1 Tax=Salmonella enterica TaxID=28901 RepID=UPI0032984261